MDKRLFKQKASDTDWMMLIIDIQKMLRSGGKITLAKLFAKHHIGHFPIDLILEMKDKIVSASADKLVTEVLVELRERVQQLSRDRRATSNVTSDIETLDFDDTLTIKETIDIAIENLKKELYGRYNIEG